MTVEVHHGLIASLRAQKIILAEPNAPPMRYPEAEAWRRFFSDAIANGVLSPREMTRADLYGNERTKLTAADLGLAS